MKMKNIYKYLRTLALMVLVIFSSCDTFELNLIDDPNALTPSQADVNFFLNSIQEDFVRQIDGDADYDNNDNWQSGGSTYGDGLSIFGAELTRMYNMGSTQSSQYASAYQASDCDDEWINAYQGILANIKAMMPLAEENELFKHIGMVQFFQAYVFTAMVDFFGDIPYTEANMGSENLNPGVDSGASIYDAALVLLDEAIANFQKTAVNPSVDMYYNNNYTKWVKAANTLKMKLYNQRRLVDPNAVSAINAILNSGNYISTTADDFQFVWPATSATGPDTRHPRYGLNYTPTGGNTYMSNWFMNEMLVSNDPRIRYYFYRQSPETPGAPGVAPNEQTLQCSPQTAPAHYIAGGFTFCYLPDGYWGRDHGDTDGIPPDGLLRTTVGVYPAGGRFDDDSFDAITSGQGGNGNGITPILTASWVDFMRAELALEAGSPSVAKTYMLAGMTKSIAKVKSFITKDAGADVSYVPTQTDVDDFMASIGTAFDNGNTAKKWNVLGEQFFVAVYGNGIESYNFYRRTGYPTTLQPNLAPNPGTFVRSLWYPSNVVNTNSNISQKPDVAQPVFWDTKGVPAAN